MTGRAAHDPTPERYRHAVVPHIMLDDAAAAVDFYERAFGAREEFRLDDPGGGVLHAEIVIGRAVLMLGDSGADGSGSAPFAAPAAIGGTSVALHVFVPDVDALTARAEAAGAEVLQPPGDRFHGDRTAVLRDPFGHVWVFLTHQEDLSGDEARRRLAATG
ncbi:VOC family protein [Streptomyces sp. JNUCC 64]